MKFIPPSSEGRALCTGCAADWPYCSVKFTVTVMMTGTGTPFSSVGVNCHCFTASSAAWSSSGIERRTFASLTRAVGADGRLDDDHALHARRLRDGRIDRLDVLASWSAS